MYTLRMHRRTAHKQNVSSTFLMVAETHWTVSEHIYDDDGSILYTDSGLA